MAEVARAIGVSPSAVRNWCTRDEEFKQLLAQYRGGYLLRGAEAAAARRVPVQLTVRHGDSKAGALQEALVDLGRKQPRRADDWDDWGGEGADGGRQGRDPRRRRPGMNEKKTRKPVTAERLNQQEET